MLRLASLCTLVLAWSVVGAQDPPPEKKADAPKSTGKTFTAPPGWGFNKSQDGSFSVLLPKDRAGIARSEKTFSQGGFTGKQQIMECNLKDGRTLLAIGTRLGGPATKDLKINDVYDLMYDLDKEPGAKLSEPKEIQVGVRKGREHYVTKKDGVERNVVVVVRGRVYQLVVLAEKRPQLTDKTAETFLTSLILHAPAATPKKGDKGGDKSGDTPKKGGS